MRTKTLNLILLAWFLFSLAVLVLVIYTESFANEQNLYPKSYYPAPPPIHYPETGAVCWRTEGPGTWECRAGRPADKTEINVETGGGVNPWWLYGNNLGKRNRPHGRSHGKPTPRMGGKK